MYLFYQPEISYIFFFLKKNPSLWNRQLQADVPANGSSDGGFEYQTLAH